MNKFLTNKKAASSLMILNLVIATIAFSFLFGSIFGAEPGEDTGPDGDILPPGGSNTGNGQTPSTGDQIAGGTSGSTTGTTSTNTIPGGTKDPVKEPGDVSIDGVKGGLTQPPGTGTVDVTGTGTGDPGNTGSPGTRRILKNLNFETIIKNGFIGAGIFGTIGTLAKGKDGPLWGAIAGGIGGAVSGILESSGVSKFHSILAGFGVATVIFLLTYKKESEQIVEFYCQPWEAPIGGQDCQLCNEFESCSEYMCKSLGQACDIINPGTLEEKCVWLNPQDVNSPIIKIIEVNKDHNFVPDTSIRPPATGVVISPNNKDCIKAFFPLEFTFTTRDSATGVGEPSQCKIDYNLTRNFENMEFFVGGNNLYSYNHTETLSLPGPNAINAVSPELKNDGDWTLYIRCQDANGNFNQDAFSVNFCVEKGPDTTPPLIVDTNIQSKNPVKFNQTNLDLEVYTNEPSDCKWSREDREYENMENQMSCSNQLWEMNNQQVYTCKTTLTGIKDRVDNDYFFKCKDQPFAIEGDRNENKQSYLYTLVGTQPLNILELSPNNTIFGATDTIPVFLEITTDNGHQNGESLCYYYNDELNNPPAKEEDYVLFLETKTNRHKQRQDLSEGNYNYYIKCIDLGGNAVYDLITFNVETDRSAPLVIRAYREAELKIITNENAECSYSHTDCNFEIESGIAMDSIDFETHTADWQVNKNFHIRCKDSYNNQPNPNTCSIIVRPSISQASTSSTGFEFIL